MIESNVIMVPLQFDTVSESGAQPAADTPRRIVSQPLGLDSKTTSNIRWAVRESVCLACEHSVQRRGRYTSGEAAYWRNDAAPCLPNSIEPATTSRVAMGNQLHQGDHIPHGCPLAGKVFQFNPAHPDQSRLLTPDELAALPSANPTDADLQAK